MLITEYFVDCRLGGWCLSINAGQRLVSNGCDILQPVSGWHPSPDFRRGRKGPLALLIPVYVDIRLGGAEWLGASQMMAVIE